MAETEGRLALWAVTARGLELARRMAGPLRAHIYRPQRFAAPTDGEHDFTRLAPALAERFGAYRGHIFLMATGIVVRLLAPLIRHKTRDPAVVVVDEQGRHAISLLAGHLGGANALALQVAELIGALPVITTATDLAGVPAVDLLACRQGLEIENPDAIRHVSTALLAGEAIGIHDPDGWIAPLLPPDLLRPLDDCGGPAEGSGGAGLWVGERILDLPPTILVLRPRCLVAGIGCNRGASCEEILCFLMDVFSELRYSINSLALLASIDLKAHEAGLLEAAQRLRRPLRFFSRDALQGVPGVQSPSDTVARHTGVESVCEASALRAAGSDRLLAGKRKRGNVTLAIARRRSTSSGWAPEARNTSRDAP
jgi:cobalt-precorrin 5A hydrolase